MLANFLRRAAGMGRAKSTVTETSIPFANVLTNKQESESTDKLVAEAQKILDTTRKSPDAKSFQIKAILMFIRAFKIAETENDQVYVLGALGPLAATYRDHPEIKEAIRKAGIHRKWIEADIIDWPKNPHGTDGRLVLDYGPPLPPPGGASSGSGPQLR